MSAQVWYNASDAKGPPPSNGWDPPSGAYIFRPNGEFGSGAPAHVRIVEGPLLTEVHQVPPGRTDSDPRPGRAQLVKHLQHVLASTHVHVCRCRSCSQACKTNSMELRPEQWTFTTAWGLISPCRQHTGGAKSWLTCLQGAPQTFTPKPAENGVVMCIRPDRPYAHWRLMCVLGMGMVPANVN